MFTIDPSKIKALAAEREAQARAAAQAAWIAYRDAILDDMAEGKAVTTDRRQEAARLRAAAHSPQP